VKNPPKAKKGDMRVYPSACTSAYCGKGTESCPTCPTFPVQQAFTRWRDATAAIADDPIWCPNVFVAQRDEEVS
jgi:ferredoxin